MVSLWTVNIVVGVAASVALAGLLRFYVRTYRKVATAFGLSLIAFATLLLAQNVIAVYSYVSLQSQGFTADVALPMLLLNALELGALLVLLRFTWE